MRYSSCCRCSACAYVAAAVAAAAAAAVMSVWAGSSACISAGLRAGGRPVVAVSNAFGAASVGSPCTNMAVHS